MINRFKEKLQRDEVVVVVNPDHPSAALTEFVGSLGVDGVFIDCEHGMAGIERVQDMCRAARAAGVQSIVRPESDAQHLIIRYLDAGAGGVMVPHVESAEAAARIVEAVRYACPRTHQDKVIVAMIESIAAIERLPSILAVDGIDVFFLGPNDLSYSMGLPAQPHHPDVKAKVKKAAAEIRRSKKVPGTLVVRDTVAEFVAAGCVYLYEHANNFMSFGAKDFRERLELGEAQKRGRH